MNGTRLGDFSLLYGLGGDRSTAPSRLSFRDPRCSTGGSGSRVYPIAECIAVFDNDGTLWPKNPLAFQLAFIIDGLKRRALNDPTLTDDPTSKPASPR